MNRTDMNKQIRGYKTGDAVKPPKSLISAMVEAANEREEKEKELPENVKKAIKKIVGRIPPKPPGKMPTSVLMDKMNRGKIQEALGKSVETGSDKPTGLDVSNRKGMTDLASRKKFKPGGSVKSGKVKGYMGGGMMKYKPGGSVKSGKPKGCGIARQGVKNAKMITMKGS